MCDNFLIIHYLMGKPESSFWATCPRSRLERSRWRGGRCACDIFDIMGFNRVLNRLSRFAAISLLFCLLWAKVDSIPIA